MSRPIGFARCFSPVGREIRVHSGIHISKTDQTDQTDRRFENKGEFAPPLGQKLTMRHPKLTGGPDQGSLAAASAL
jgi:hypothetical protein